MGATLAYGSLSTRYTTTGTKTVVAAGVGCVLDKILINGASAATDFSCAVSTIGNTVLHNWSASIDTTDADLQRFGLWCGPWGIGSTDGLKLTLAGTLGIDITVVYRTGVS